MTTTCTLISLMLPSGCSVEFVQAERAYRITCPNVYMAQWVFIDIRPAVKRAGIPSISTNQPFDKLRR
ncbi:hypothetical protein [Planktothrix agardhii]|uniref:hypothetical protein n=1 Tax=Planktothrix agardhii TaxID=1160 RepID=UPI001D0A7079|nr:hypothetical protein [Planktothrix agardhii]MCB8788986.1 hypothetical protein [Planktothrix agardhii 1025]MCF3614289.1 hypothetical protein [Planktothrix agardhii 1027]MCF3648070.1 hypothetical protein [Planktothrix agardhii 1026]